MQQSSSFNTQQPQESHLKNILTKCLVRSKKLFIRVERKETGMHLGADGNRKDEIMTADYQGEDNKPFPWCQWLVEHMVNWATLVLFLSHLSSSLEINYICIFLSSHRVTIKDVFILVITDTKIKAFETDYFRITMQSETFFLYSSTAINSFLWLRYL